MDATSLEPPAKRPRLGDCAVSSPAIPRAPIDVIDLVNDSDVDNTSSPDDGDDEIIITPVRTACPRPSDLVIVPSPPCPTGTVIPPSSSGTVLDDEVQATVIWKNAVIYPHARSDCMARRFDRKPSNAAHDLNVLHCDKCYCCT